MTLAKPDPDQKRGRSRTLQETWVSMTHALHDGSRRDCGSTHFLAAHHVIARAGGGADLPPNLIALRAGCRGRIEAAERLASALT